MQCLITSSIFWRNLHFHRLRNQKAINFKNAFRTRNKDYIGFFLFDFWIYGDRVSLIQKFIIFTLTFIIYYLKSSGLLKSFKSDQNINSVCMIWLGIETIISARLFGKLI